MSGYIKFFVFTLSFLSVFFSVVIAINVSRSLSRAEGVKSIPPGTQVIPVADKKKSPPADSMQLKHFTFVTITPRPDSSSDGDDSGDKSGQPPNTKHVPASKNTCGKYDFSKWPEKNPLGNYGDPECNFTKAKLADFINKVDPKHKHEWFDMIIKRETGGTYTPNAHAPPSGEQASLDAGGAWGMYQMGSSSPPGKAPPAPGKNGTLDRGDVNWEMQTTMAVNYNRQVLKCSFAYWRSQREGEVGASPC